MLNSASEWFKLKINANKTESLIFGFNSEEKFMWADSKLNILGCCKRLLVIDPVLENFDRSSFFQNK